MTYIPRLKQEYKERIIAALKEEFGYKNVMQVPKLEKIVVSRGVGSAVADKKQIEYAVDELTKITGQKGKILNVDREKNRAIVEGINLISKHTKPSAQNPQGGIIKKEAPIHISNLSLLDPKTGEPTKVGYEVRDGKKVRVSKKSKQVL